MFTLRVARPTDNLPEVTKFYRDGLGLEVLSSFSGHNNGFEGVILGGKGSPYHLEFTHQQGHQAGKAPSQDNLLVFYIPDEAEWKNAIARMRNHGYEPVKSYNPWWDDGGQTFEDIDGYRVVLYNKGWDK
jgi:catechol 2,3-dioxygenase-like lactoylglutathione lyase family enzyme